MSAHGTPSRAAASRQLAGSARDYQAAYRVVMLEHAASHADTIEGVLERLELGELRQLAGQLAERLWTEAER